MTQAIGQNNEHIQTTTEHTKKTKEEKEQVLEEKIDVKLASEKGVPSEKDKITQLKEERDRLEWELQGLLQEQKKDKVILTIPP